MNKQAFLLIFLLNFSAYAESKVLAKNAHGFTIQIEETVSVDSKKAYQQFVNVGQWWNAEHSYFGKSENFSIQAKAGGCFCEIDGKRQVLHMTVSLVDPGKEIRMIGGLGPLQMMGVSGGMSWKFVSLGKNQSKIIHRYQVSGSIDGGLDSLAEIVDKVQQRQLLALVSKLTSAHQN